MGQAKPIEHNRRLTALSLTVVMLSCAVNAANASTEILIPSDYRIMAAGDKFDGVRQYAVAFEIRPPRRLRSRHLELAVGSMSGSSSDRAFLSFGPVWRFPFARDTAFVDFGFSPTLISGSDFDGRDLGGSFHFTSSVSVGASFGRRQSIGLSLRAQHTSNGGLSDANPGIDMFGINITLNFSDL